MIFKIIKKIFFYLIKPLRELDTWVFKKEIFEEKKSLIINAKKQEKLKIIKEMKKDFEHELYIVQKENDLLRMGLEVEIDMLNIAIKDTKKDKHKTKDLQVQLNKQIAEILGLGSKLKYIINKRLVSQGDEYGEFYKIFDDLDKIKKLK